MADAQLIEDTNNVDIFEYLQADKAKVKKAKVKIDNIEFTIRNITDKELLRIQKKYNNDGIKIQIAVIAMCSLIPNFNNKNMIEKYNVADENELVEKSLSLGKQEKLSSSILHLSGLTAEQRKSDYEQIED